MRRGRQASYEGVPSTPLTDCRAAEADFSAGMEAANHYRADLVIHDAPDHPTSKNQCTNGDWREYAFRKKGQCVAYVERGPKPGS